MSDPVAASSPLIVDCSVSAAWVLGEQGLHAARMLKAVADRGAVVPPLWRIEMVNVLRSSIRRGRIDEAHAHRALGLLQELPIEVDGSLPGASELLALACRHGLTAYDACYLELAMRRGLALATLDTSLARAAEEAGCAVM